MSNMLPATYAPDKYAVRPRRQYLVYGEAQRRMHQSARTLEQIQRHGKIVNSEGQLIDQVEMAHIETIRSTGAQEGRIVDMLQLFF